MEPLEDRTTNGCGSRHNRQTAEPRALIEDRRILDLIDRMVCSLAFEQSMRQDLTQEALIHLWKAERDRPGQSTSWYLQGCRFRLQHYLAAGRSLDSTKRRRGQIHLAEDAPGLPLSFDELPATNHDFDEACTRDIVSTLSDALRPRERAVLACLADGLLTRDIVFRLKLSAPTVTKYRRRIAKLAVKLGIASPKSLGQLYRGRGDSAHQTLAW